MAKNLKMGVILDHLAQNLRPQFFFVSFLSTSSKTLFQAIILSNLKEN